ncbi:MAG: T9SS type A sorting domain-containing protein [Bacteroidetes bacterium]|nr:T9SS type A sorting domain-containing protein [Bacteroidota bacterium]
MRRVIIIQSLILISINLFSQTEITPFVEKSGQKFDYQRYKQIFSDIDTSSISTGFLSDKSFQLISFVDYDGSDSAKTITYSRWQQLYAQVEASQIGHRLPILDSIYYRYSQKSKAITQYDNDDDIRNVKENINNEDFIPISVIDINYNTIKKDAFERNLLNVSDEKIKETPQRRESPYIIENLYVATALKNTIYQGSNVNFLFDDAFYFTNKAQNNVQYSIDFDDGLGLRDIDWGQTLNVSYSFIGEKTIKLIKTYESNLKNTTIEEPLIATFSIVVKALTTPSPTFTIPLNIAIPSNYPHGGVNVKGTGYVYTSDGSQNIRNPIIICEGFDPLNERGWNELYDLLNRQNFIECLKSNGYDFIILDFAQGATYIERNAYLLKGLIENINARKVTQNKLVVVGASMGGLVSRYALAYMEKNGLNHNTRLFISFDSPQQGANIPLGVQYWFQFFSFMSPTVEGMYDNLLCSIAARQMLTYHATSFPSTNSLRASFVQNLNNVGYPSNLRKIAIANGSGNAYGQRRNDGTIFNSTDQIVNWRYRSFRVDIDGNSWAVPNISPYTKIFDGNIDIVWFAFWKPNDKSMTVHVSGTYPYDNAPGGTTNTMEEMAASNTGGYGNITTNINNHCFIPTTSSLAINTSNLFYNINSDPNILSKTPFDAIYYPINTNEEHVYISEACVSWIMNELVPQNVVLNGVNDNWNTGVVRAGNSISLKPGFSTVPGKTFHAYINPLQPCAKSALKSTEIVDDNNSISNQQDFLSDLKIENNNEVSILAFPNPNNGRFSIQIKNAENIDGIEVKNIQGITVYKTSGNEPYNEIFIDITNRPNGIYLVNVSLNGKIHTTKIIKNNVQD